MKEHPCEAYEYLALLVAEETVPDELFKWHAYLIDERLAELVDDEFSGGKKIVPTSLGELALDQRPARKPLPPNGAKVKVEDVPTVCRELGHPEGAILDAPYLAGSVAWDIRSVDLNRAFDAGELTYRIKVGRAFVYRYDELIVFKKTREARKKP